MSGEQNTSTNKMSHTSTSGPVGENDPPQSMDKSSTAMVLYKKPVLSPAIPPTEFHLFPLLPVELRQKIWGLVMEPRFVFLSIIWDRGLMRMTPSTDVNLLQVNWESRALALVEYSRQDNPVPKTPLHDLEDRQLSLQWRFNNCRRDRFLVSTKQDIFVFVDISLFYSYLQDIMGRDKDFAEVRHLALPDWMFVSPVDGRALEKWERTIINGTNEAYIAGVAPRETRGYGIWAFPNLEMVSLIVDEEAFFGIHVDTIGKLTPLTEHDERYNAEEMAYFTRLVDISERAVQQYRENWIRHYETEKARLEAEVAALDGAIDQPLNMALVFLRIQYGPLTWPSGQWRRPKIQFAKLG